MKDGTEGGVCMQCRGGMRFRFGNGMAVKSVLGLAASLVIFRLLYLSRSHRQIKRPRKR